MAENKEIYRILKRIFRLGKVVGINADTCKARVEFPDNQNIVTYELPVIQPHTAKDKFYSMPAIDEYVLCAFLPNGLEAGFILGSYYSEPTPTPVQDENKFNITFEDGTVLEYDKGEHKLMASVKGSCYVEAEKEIDVKTDDILTVNAAKTIDIKTDDALTITTSKDITIKAEGNINIACKEAEVTGDKVTVKSSDITLGNGSATGIITQECFCALTGGPHPDKSNAVRAIK